jgi:hypothetical protein
MNGEHRFGALRQHRGNKFREGFLDKGEECIFRQIEYLTRVLFGGMDSLNDRSFKDAALLGTAKTILAVLR